MAEYYPCRLPHGQHRHAYELQANHIYGIPIYDPIANRVGVPLKGQGGRGVQGAGLLSIWQVKSARDSSHRHSVFSLYFNVYSRS